MGDTQRDSVPQEFKDSEKKAVAVPKQPKLCIEHIAKALNKAEFRDKFGRMFQFTALALTGLADLAKPAQGTRIHILGRSSWHAFFHLALSRRMHRFLKGFIFHDKLCKTLKTLSSPVDKGLQILSVAFLQTFFMIDHYAWLKQIKLLPASMWIDDRPERSMRKARGMQTVYFGIRFFCVSSVFSTLFSMKKLYDLYQEPDYTDEVKACDWKSRRRTHAKNTLKFAMRIFETAHISKLYVTHDFPVGISGVISSAMDSVDQWSLA
jgi:hypothetical protein